MTDVSNRRREPNGTPKGGRFADEHKDTGDVADLEEARLQPRPDLPGIMTVGDEWSRVPCSSDTYLHTYIPEGTCEFADGRGGILRTYDQNWYDKDLGDCEERQAKYISPQGSSARVCDMRTGVGETGEKADISDITPDDLKAAIMRVRIKLKERTGLESERVEVDIQHRGHDDLVSVRAVYPMLDEPRGLHPLKARRIRRENERRRAMCDWTYL